MARSSRRSKIAGVTTCPSEKQAKAMANRRFRHIVKQRMKVNDVESEALIPLKRETIRDFELGKDGKQFLNDDAALVKQMRK